MNIYVVSYDDEDLEAKKWEYNYQPFFVVTHSESYTEKDIKDFFEQATQEMLKKEKKIFDPFSEILSIFIEKYGFKECPVTHLNATEELVEYVEKTEEF